MNEAARLASFPHLAAEVEVRWSELRHAIEHAAHLLPSQAPIRVFVHHNTLHAFEHLPFDEAVAQGMAVYGCHPYLPESRYRQLVARGRILPQDLYAELVDDLNDEADRLVAFLGTRFHLRLAMLLHPLPMGSEVELRWLLTETDMLGRFRPAAPPNVRRRMIEETRRWAMRELRFRPRDGDGARRRAHAEVFDRFDEARIERWDEATWEAFTLRLLWSVCRAGVHGVRRTAPPRHSPLRLRDLLLEATGADSDRLVNEELIRFCGAFLDQGLARWALPGREEGFFRAFSALYRESRPVKPWLALLPGELKRIEAAGLSPLAMIDQALAQFGCDGPSREELVRQALLALPGWAGMIWQLETNAHWVVHPAPPGTLVEYLAVRLLLEELALAWLARDTLGYCGPLDGLRHVLAGKIPRAPRVSVEQRACFVFELAQRLGWKPEDLDRQTKAEWSALVHEIERFGATERRRIFQHAFERRYRHQTLDALAVRAALPDAPQAVPEFQVVCCIDEREESFRRHLEEVAPGCETFGVAGFFGVAMYYRGVTDAHFVPLAPVVIKPRHYVREEVVYSFAESHRRRTVVRRALGMVWHGLHTASRSLLGGALASVFGSLASIPLVLSVLMPRGAARISRLLAGIVLAEPKTRQVLERRAAIPGPEPECQGFSIDEMVQIGGRVLADIGLTRRFARLVFLVGHGSTSLNNPHESAHDCGACGGGRGGPNARALAAMLNDPRVRERLADQGLVIPADTIFIGAYHNTCDDGLEYYDLDHLPSSHHREFEAAVACFDAARRRNAHERCRRFESAELALGEEAALRHVQARAADLSQVRPEFGHATNAVCIVGRRRRTKGLFLDRRAFLASYDPSQDDQRLTILERILQAVIPVCAGISLEYYFCYVDPTGYGCGTKLPHNITGLLGVMDGAASDLRTGLPWQMVEIHEPVRILFVVEARPAALLAILARNPDLDRLVRNQWVQLAALDPDCPRLELLRGSGFEPYQPESTSLPSVASSVEWYRGWRDHLGYALVGCGGAEPRTRREGSGE